MDTGFKISRSLTFINLAGTLAIIWLAGSFFVQAERQRRDANASLRSNEIQGALYAANVAVLRELFEVSYLSGETSDGVAHSISTLNKLFAETDAAFDRAVTHLSSTSKEQQFLDRIFHSEKSLNDELQQLRGYSEQLTAYRNQSQHQLALCLLYTSPSPRDATLSRMPSSA